MWRPSRLRDGHVLEISIKAYPRSPHIAVRLGKIGDLNPEVFNLCKASGALRRALQVVDKIAMFVGCAFRHDPKIVSSSGV